MVDVDVEPFVHQATVGVLSEPTHSVALWTGLMARQVMWLITPHSSRLELVIVPPGLSKEISVNCISGGKGRRQITGFECPVVRLVGNHTPPMLSLEASNVPMRVGAVGT